MNDSMPPPGDDADGSHEPIPFASADEVLEGVAEPIAREAAEADALTSEQRDQLAKMAQLSDPSNWFVQPGVPGVRASLFLGAFCAVLATWVAFVRTASPTPALYAFGVLYSIGFHTAGGVVAVRIAAAFSERGFNMPILAGARLLPAVAMFHLCLNLSLPIPFEIEEHALAFASYFFVAWAMFRLPRFELGLLCVSHLVVWVAMQIAVAFAVAQRQAFG